MQSDRNLVVTIISPITVFDIINRHVTVLTKSTTFRARSFFLLTIFIRLTIET